MVANFPPFSSSGRRATYSGDRTGPNISSTLPTSSRSRVHSTLPSSRTSNPPRWEIPGIEEEEEEEDEEEEKEEEEETPCRASSAAAAAIDVRIAGSTISSPRPPLLPPPPPPLFSLSSGRSKGTSDPSTD